MGMRIKSVGAPMVALALAGLLAGCGEQAPEAAKERAPYPIQGLANVELYGDPRAGQERFQQSCAECHGADARGTDQGPALVHRIYEPSHHADITFFIAVEHGVVAHHWKYGDMPPIPGLEHADVAHRCLGSS